MFFADGALLVYDVTDKNSFNKVTRWVAELRDAVGDDITISIAGNKIDLEEHRQVHEQEAIRWGFAMLGSLVASVGGWCPNTRCGCVVESQVRGKRGRHPLPHVCQNRPRIRRDVRGLDET
jgi:GTPase SAR1 family protein